MANSYFRFRQFTIHQDQCAMKVSTDACILGAWFASRLGNSKSALDVGTGTGLLMLMLAQKNNLKIDGIELDHPAFLQLRENLESSNWKNNLMALPGDARNFSFSKKYDFIISNPPFFENDLPSPSLAKNQAKHDSTLTLAELVRIIDENLESQGSFGLLVPYHRMDWLIELCYSKNFFISEKLLIRQTPGHNHFRALLHFSRIKKESVMSGELIIKDANDQYTESFTALMKDYYLHL